jgi:hypothetical protein
MAEYRIEVRLSGYAKEHVRRLLYAAARRFNLSGSSKKSLEPSISVYGPFKTEHPEDVMRIIQEVSSRYDVVSYRMVGFKHFEVGRKWLIFNNGMRGIYLDVEPSESLTRLRDELSNKLSTICMPLSVMPGRFKAMIEFEETGDRFERILSYLKDNDVGRISQRIVKITLVKNSSIACEYDFVLKRLNIPRQNYENRYLKRTMTLIRRTENEALSPIWSFGRDTTARRRPARQITLVEDNPTARLPKALVPKRMIAAKKGQLHTGTRQITLVEDNPAKRIPRMLVLSLPKSLWKSPTKAKTKQAKLSVDSIWTAPGFLEPIRRGAQKLAPGLMGQDR